MRITNKDGILPFCLVCLDFLLLLHSVVANPATVFIAILGRVVDQAIVGLVVLAVPIAQKCYHIQGV